MHGRGVVARDPARSYALLERERPGAPVTPAEACLIRDALPGLREARRTGGDDATLAGAVVAHVRAGNGASYEVDVPRSSGGSTASAPCSSWP